MQVCRAGGGVCMAMDARDQRQVCKPSRLFMDMPATPREPRRPSSMDQQASGGTIATRKVAPAGSERRDARRAGGGGGYFCTRSASAST